MSEAHSSMLTPVTDNYADLATALLTHYSFDLSGYSASELIRRWQANYPIEWLHIAVIEALYQGRYKAVSVQQILNFWHRRGQATYHFNMEFERLICSKFPESLTSIHTPVLYPAKKSVSPENNNYHLSSASGEPSPTKVERDYSQRKLAPVKVMREVEQPPVISEDTEEAVAYATIPPVAAVSPSHQAQSDHKSQRLLPSSASHHPIGQFTPDTSDRTESFTSKLKAMSSRPMGKTYTREKIKDENSAKTYANNSQNP
ncbi:hypothetical protein NIES2100_21930 [Calothrix sp. NIES-2100]|uniref:hypothetical protein n=1 Tax=Calothrix sp. NIES-2100 TaxID=1954172 RepID=UPI000B60746A|nr:hypothetical protein NIES2100_21930 [Calothrix sp. NIES-2100]